MQFFIYYKVDLLYLYICRHTIENCSFKIVSKPLIFNKKQAIKNTGILPLDDTDSQDEIEENEHEKIEENECREIQNLIDKFEYTYPLTAKEYIRIDQENEIDGETPTKKQIVAILKENNSISDDESDSEITLVSSSENWIIID
ncbi:hypothetical protein RhiirA5_412948 [Rhizophagus irregularis]|uniref:Uncharacterized protein n=1 Tax=Rhizophagus irregularis TaxID=588596 RepID=A0A2N0PXK8_9GLOM|nr:hypothetical protein RhiirA5_412948 [Rhizophagus irregularis]